MKTTPPKTRFQISRTPIIPERVRQIEGGFAFIEHRFLHRGFFAHLSCEELLLYLLLVLAGDRRGMSFYGGDALCSLCRLSPGSYLLARNALIAKDLIAYDGRRFQVLSLPTRPVTTASFPLVSDEDFVTHDPDTIRTIIQASLNLDKSGRT